VDIYFDMDYLKNSERIEKGKLDFFFYEDNNGKGKNIFIKREVKQNIVEDSLYDLITPYGYGGPLIEIKQEDNKEVFIETYFKKYEEYCNKNNIVSEFVRFHPLEKNYEYSKDFYNVTYNSNTIFIDLSSEEIIESNIISKARNMIRKAEKNHLVFEEDKKFETIEKFIELYYETMNKNNASALYYFDKEYFYDIFLLKNKVKLFNVKHEDKIIATSMILIGEKWIHYHLSANTEIGYKLAANNFLLYNIAKWGHKNGYKKFHLGGGYGGNESPLYKFKHSMNKNGILEFYIGKKIFNKELYEKLVDEKMLNDKEKENTFFPLYRLEV
jgi:hypothetical protein